MQAAGWMSIREQIQIATATQTWKIVHLRKPLRMTERMTITDYYRIITQGPRLQFNSECYRWRAAREWNQLSMELRMESSISRLKKELKRKILDGRNTRPPDPD